MPGKKYEQLLPPGEDPGEGYQGAPDMYPDYEEDKKDQEKMSPEEKQYMQSRGYSTGGMCRGGGKAIRGMKFGGVK